MNIKETKRSITLNGQGDWVVYRHIRLDKHEPFYIGIAKDKNRPYNKKDRSSFWKRITSKSEYRVEILFEGLKKEEAIAKEMEFIKLYKRSDLKQGTLCNMTSGGEGTGNLNKDLESIRVAKIKSSLIGRKHSNESKIKMCLNQRNRITISVNGIQFLSLRQAALYFGMHKNTIKKLYFIK
jgi:predicted GIY-YIG superfamily endonuclease